MRTISCRITTPLFNCASLGSVAQFGSCNMPESGVFKMKGFKPLHLKRRFHDFTIFQKILQYVVFKELAKVSPLFKVLIHLRSRCMLLHGLGPRFNASPAFCASPSFLLVAFSFPYLQGPQRCVGSIKCLRIACLLEESHAKLEIGGLSVIKRPGLQDSSHAQPAPLTRLP